MSISQIAGGVLIALPFVIAFEIVRRSEGLLYVASAFVAAGLMVASIITGIKLCFP
jgi:hypothetical protein